MKFLLFISPVLAIGTSAPFSCGAPKPHASLLPYHATLIPKSPIIVTTHIHIIASSPNATSSVPSALITSQMAVVNTDFRPSGISFIHQSTSRTFNAAWAIDPVKHEANMTAALRRGTYKDLNLYFVEDASGNAGYAYPPFETGGNYTFDGAWVRYNTMPGNEGPQGLGKTATHEIGHWFGLYHTFDSVDGEGCAGAGDEVDDTPAQASASDGCPVGRDSCPDQPGLDPIHNYMDYSDE